MLPFGHKYYGLNLTQICFAGSLTLGSQIFTDLFADKYDLSDTAVAV
jgi:hypothetical protein